jgi:hypothetical protein
MNYETTSFSQDTRRLVLLPFRYHAGHLVRCLVGWAAGPADESGHWTITVRMLISLMPPETTTYEVRDTKYGEREEPYILGTPDELWFPLLFICMMRVASQSAKSCNKYLFYRLRVSRVSFVRTFEPFAVCTSCISDEWRDESGVGRSCDPLKSQLPRELGPRLQCSAATIIKQVEFRCFTKLFS